MCEGERGTSHVSMVASCVGYMEDKTKICVFRVLYKYVQTVAALYLAGVHLEGTSTADSHEHSSLSRNTLLYPNPPLPWSPPFSNKVGVTMLLPPVPGVIFSNRQGLVHNNVLNPELVTVCASSSIEPSKNGIFT